MAKKKKSVSEDSVVDWFDLEPTDKQWEDVEVALVE
jgi:hypothetical protein